MPTRCAVLLATFGVAVASQALATDELSGLYVGGNFGRARNALDANSLDTELASEAEAAGDTLSLTKRSTSRLSYTWSADVGYFFTPFIGLEAGFLHVGEIRHITVGTIAGEITKDSILTTTEISSHGPDLSLVFRLPLTEAFEVDLRIGDYLGKTTYVNGDTIGTNSDYIALSKTDSSVLAGAGLAFNLTAHYSIRVDYLRIQHTGDESISEKFNVDMATAGVKYSF